jgi:SMI1/KNR4 family protein SUKH-1
MESFESLLNHADPGFMCYAGGDKSKKEAFLVRVEHLANPAADMDVLKTIPNVPGANAAKEFYARHNGALLYTEFGLDGSNGGIEIFSPKEWPDRTAQMVESWEGYEDARMPYGKHDFVAFAHSRGASSYIHWVIRGPTAGTIYWWAWTMPPLDHEPPLAKDFGAFIELISREPVRFLNELTGCYARFTDDQTVTEWIPARYVPDCEGMPLPLSR